MPEPGDPAFSTFGELLKYLRRRARLTQRELAIAVGYTEGHISRLEKNQRLPDLATVAALFIPALLLEQEPETAARLMQLAARAHGETIQAGRSRTLAHTQEAGEGNQGIASIPSNLPIQLTTFIGRQSELRALTELLSGTSRLITLTGPGGMGKTRLALQTVIGLFHLYRDGVWFVDLTPLSTPELIAQTVAAALGIKETSQLAVEESLVEALQPRHLLIVLDNCEHLLAEAARFVEKLLRACARLQILATSREPLHVPGEINYRVPPLSLPDDRQGASQHLMSHEAAQLFVERASNLESSFTITGTNAATVARICRQLDGLPLAIELAAARIDVLSLNQIEARLDDRFRLLTRGSATVPRHQTLHATLEWSHELLSEAEKILFRRLAVFAGGWTLEAANFICAEEGNDILDLVAGLVNKSLVTVERLPDGGVRYSTLETIREFAREQLLAAGETQPMRLRHFDYFLWMTEQAESKLFAAESSMDWAEAEIDNLRAALTWALEPREKDQPSPELARRGLELVLHVWLLWWSRGYLAEGTEWLNRLLAADTARTPVRARALLLAADLAGLRGDTGLKVAAIQEALAIAEETGDRKRLADARMEMGLVERDLGHYPEAIEFLMKGLAGFEELNENLWICRVSFLLAETYVSTGDMQIARSFLQRGMELAREEGDLWQTAWGLEIMGNTESFERHLEQAETYYRESLDLRIKVDDRTGIVFALEAFAGLAARRREFQRAAVLWGAAEGLRKALNLLTDPLRESLRAAPLAATRQRLGKGAFRDAWSDGQTMQLQQAVQYALQRSAAK